MGRRSRVYTIVNPIDEAVFNNKVQRHPIKGRVLYAGRVHPAKGLLCLAKACKRLRECCEFAEVVLVGVYDKAKGGGGNEFLEILRDAAAPCPVTATGAISDPGQLADIERTADVFVYPSEDALGEACPIAPMEAMALGVPTIVSGMKCYDDYVEDGVNAVKFAVGEDKQLCSEICRILTDDSFAARLGNTGAKLAEKYSKKRVAARYEDVFKFLVGEA